MSARKNFNTYKTYFKNENGMVKLKKYFYILRPILACKWVLGKKTSPPMLFSELADMELDERLKPVVDNLLSLKMHTSELGESMQITELNEYIEQNLASLKTAVESLPPEHKTGWDDLNRLFIQILNSK